MPSSSARARAGSSTRQSAAILTPQVDKLAQWVEDQLNKGLVYGPHVLAYTPLIKDHYADFYAGGILHVCCFCFAPTKSAEIHQSHLANCENRGNPVGTVIQEAPMYTLYQVKAASEMDFCRRLCSFAGLFINAKNAAPQLLRSSIYTVVVKHGDPRVGREVMGYFSKDSNPIFLLNCIAVFPPYQKRQLGTALVDLAYKVAVDSNRPVGKPEEPLSEAGKALFQSYWQRKIREALAQRRQGINLTAVTTSEISRLTNIHIDNVKAAVAVMDVEVADHGLLRRNMSTGCCMK